MDETKREYKVVKLCLRQILMDRRSLADYTAGRRIGFEDVKRRLLLEERDLDPVIPDHIYITARDAVFQNDKIEDLCSLLTKGIAALAGSYLCIDGNRVAVRNKYFSEWQELLTICPPLLLIAAFLWKNKCDPEIDNCPNYYMRTVLAPNVKHTALLPPASSKLREKCRQFGGFNDLHIHLNGSTETDLVWQDALNNVHWFTKSCRKAFGNQLVKEQYEQEEIFEDADELEALLDTARILRYYLANSIYDSKEYPYSENIRTKYRANILREEHPLKIALNINDNNNKDKTSSLEYECLMYIHIMKQLENRSNKHREKMAQAFHHYLLILGAINRFLVHQIHQNGFRQFQKITYNDLRNISEEGYKQRFFQLSGNDPSMSYFRILEGRFAPKDTPQKIHKHIQKIRKGWTHFIKDKSPNNQSELRLISHFIKKKESEAETIYHEKLRNELWRNAEALLSLWQDDIWNKCPCNPDGECIDSNYRLHKLVGIDAAASEFDAPPEVFAPVFRMMRRKLGKDKCHFTFHAGEDFSHVISGIRAIYEAMIFFNMEEGDRIGHATALGIDYQLWQQRVGTKGIWIKKGELLDNLIFLRYLYKTNWKIVTCGINGKIKQLLKEIYPQAESIPNDAETAWLNRYRNPLMLRYSHFKDAALERTFDKQEWDNFQINKPNRNVLIMMEGYYLQQHRKEKYDQYTYLEPNYFCSNWIKVLQLMVRKEIKRRHMVIETLPTSNVRISIYRNHSEHHLKRWQREKLDVVVGCDDAGIFATNIYNEYAHVSKMTNNKTFFKLNKTANHSAFK